MPALLGGGRTQGRCPRRPWEADLVPIRLTGLSVVGGTRLAHPDALSAEEVGGVLLFAVGVMCGAASDRPTSRFGGMLGG